MNGAITCEVCDGINDAHRTIRAEEKMASPLERLSMMTSPVSPRSCVSFSLILPAARGGRKFYRIQALGDFGGVSAGDLRGFIESDASLSHAVNPWVRDDCLAIENAYVCDDAQLKENSCIGEEPHIALLRVGYCGGFGRQRSRVLR
jgi:hypothetical protein